MDTLRETGIHARHDRLGALMDRLGLSALALRRSANFAWYTGGADHRVAHMKDSLPLVGLRRVGGFPGHGQCHGGCLFGQHRQDLIRIADRIEVLFLDLRL